MTEATDLASAIGQCVGAAAAVLGLGFIGWQVKEARKTSDIQSLQAFLRDTKEHEHALLEAKTVEAKDQSFIELLNFLEAYAAAINGGLFPKITRDIVREKLIDSIAVITESDAWHVKLAEAVTSESTFQCLRQFMRKEKAAINAVISARASLTRP
ncbi:MAG: hypothetical protein ACR652_08535 [Methylocystis sp.]|uniref:hypothetical protein n=1 Tax=Methylocystis sp. TaxID=1911079 RepID=UPI003DA65B00